MEHQTLSIDGTDYRIVWEVIDEYGRVKDETVSEDHAHGIIADANKHDKWSVNDRLEEIKE